MLFAVQKAQVDHDLSRGPQPRPAKIGENKSIWYTAKKNESTNQIEHKLLLVRMQNANNAAAEKIVNDCEGTGLALCICLDKLDPDRAHLVTYNTPSGQPAQIVIGPFSSECQAATLKAERRVLLETVTTLKSNKDVLQYRVDAKQRHEDKLVHENVAQIRYLEKEHLNALTELNELKIQLEMAKADETCIICYNAPRNIVYQCGHRSVCHDCDQKMARIDDRCPICRADIVFRIQTT